MRKCCSITRMRSILYFASDEETVLTQQEICNAFFLPKQTVNTAIAGLAQKGLVELELIPGTRNKKRILLTDAGRNWRKIRRTGCAGRRSVHMENSRQKS